MKYKSYLPFVFTLLCTIIFTACSSNVKEEINRAEELATIAPDSAFAILEDIRTDALEDAKVKPDYDLAWAEVYYMKYRTLTDSVIETLSNHQESPGSKQAVMKDILQAIYLFRINKEEEAFSLFETCSREITDEIGLYWKCVVYDHLGIICLDAGFGDQAKKYFYEVLESSEALGDIKAISNANSHISCYYQMTNRLDSALFYAKKVLEHENVLDSQMLAIAYQNLYYIQLSIKDSLRANNVDIFQLYEKYKVNTADTLLTLALVSQAYYLNAQLDSAPIYQRIVERGRHNNAKLVLYKFLSDYYQEHENMDSAFKYLKLYGRMDSICIRAKSIVPLLNTVYMHNQDEATTQSRRQKVLIAVISVIAILVVVILLLVRHKRRMITAYEEIGHQNIRISTLDKQKEQLNNDLRVLREESSKLQDKVSEQEKTIESTEHERKHLKEELNNTQKTLQATQAELEQTTSTLTRAHNKIEGYQTLISKKNSKLAQAGRELRKSDSNKKDYSQKTVLEFLDKTICRNEKMNKNQMQYIIDSYESSTGDRGDFLRSLMRKSEGLTSTGIIICILYHEGFTDEEIVFKLNYNPKNFKMAKSRARAAIDLPVNSDSSFVKSLLQRFDNKKYGV